MKLTFSAHTPPKNSDRSENSGWHSLKEHLQEVSNLAKKFAAQLGAEELGHYAGLWHDLGKYNPKFQEYLQQCHAEVASSTQRKRRGPNHAIYGAILANEICPLYQFTYCMTFMARASKI
jgi:CRISPR-associated endonuclease/helicase Cas3